MNLLKTAGRSFRYYLFALIASLIVILALVQVFFFNMVQDRIQNEIQQKSQTLSNAAVKVVSEQFSQIFTSVREANMQEHSLVTIHIEETPNVEVDLGDGYYFVTGDKTKTIRTLYGDPNQVASLPNRFSNGFVAVNPDTDLAVTRIGDAFQFSVHNPTQGVEKHIVHFDQTSAVEHYFRWLLFGTLALMLLGLLYAFWLSGKISLPLERLAQGFRQLQQGRFGSRVPEQGIADIKATMSQFNTMSERLLDLKTLEKKVDQQQQLLELNEVSRGLAHTLRNPLNTIGLATEQMAAPGVDEAERKVLANQVRDKINHLDRTIQTMLNLNLQQVDRSQQLDLVQVVQDVVLELSFNYKGKIHFDPPQPLPLCGSAPELRAVIHTLLCNAVEASTHNQDIQIAAYKDNRQIVVTVVDQGEGLDPAIKADLFKPHVSSKPEGAGMGLFIANRICQFYYNGSISLTDNQPTGCIAQVRLATKEADDG